MPVFVKQTDISRHMKDRRKMSKKLGCFYPFNTFADVAM